MLRPGFDEGYVAMWPCQKYANKRMGRGGCISDEEDKQATQSFCSPKLPLLNTKQFTPYPAPHHVRMVARPRPASFLPCCVKVLLSNKGQGSQRDYCIPGFVTRIHQSTCRQMLAAPQILALAPSAAYAAQKQHSWRPQPQTFQTSK